MYVVMKCSCDAICIVLCVVHDVMGALSALLTTQLKKLTESAFLENYAAVVILLDEIIQCSHWESTEFVPSSTRN